MLRKELKEKNLSPSYTQTDRSKKPLICLTGRTNLSQRQGSCATTSVRKVELGLESNFLSGSNFLSRLVRQVISVPFVV